MKTTPPCTPLPAPLSLQLLIVISLIAQQLPLREGVWGTTEPSHRLSDYCAESCAVKPPGLHNIHTLMWRARRPRGAQSDRNVNSPAVMEFLSGSLCTATNKSSSRGIQ